MISMISQTLISSYKFNRPPQCIKFSPCGKFIGVCVDHLGEF
jgi:hypothetical protein